MKDRPDAATFEMTRRSAVTASLLAIGMVLTQSANAAKEGKSLKKKNATKGGLFNPAQRSQELALAEEQRKAQLKEKYAKLRAEGGAPAAQ
ncbi:g4506 [Coccomyxa elongata]